jgi:hypothetical protein
MSRRVALVSLTLVLGVAGLGVIPARPAAACSKRHQTVFELFDEARTVAVARVVATPGLHRAGRVTLTVRDSLKGGRGRVTARETNTSCRTGFRGGRTALVFIGADGRPVGHYEGYIEKPSAALVATMRAWAGAATPAERTAVLVAAIGGADAIVAYDAAMYLADEPALLAALDATALASLDAVAATGAVRDHRVEMVLARVHGTAWRAMSKAKRTPGGLPFTALAAHDYESITSPAKLADIIAAGTGEYGPDRIAAMERCERIHGHRLERFAFYGRGVATQYWLKLADACRTGTPVP